ncbi:MAG: RNA polymerase sigma factor [Phycisphaerae bacterium]
MPESTDAFLSLVRPYWQRLHAVAQRYAANDHDARDLVQEALMRAWKGFNPSDDRVYHAGWLFVILCHVAAEWGRARSRRIRLIPVDRDELTELAPNEPSEPYAPFPSFQDEQFREFLDDRIVAAVESLDPVFQEVLLLSVGGDLTYREVAEVLDCPLGTVMSRMGRARRALRERLADFAAERGWKAEVSP